MIKKIIIIVAIIIALFSVLYVFSYQQWLTRKTAVTTREFGNASSTIILKREEVVPYFEKLNRKTGQDALINVKYVPSSKFNFPREFHKKILTYWAAISYSEEISYLDLRLMNMDEYEIDPFGLAIYRDFYLDKTYDSFRELVVVESSWYNLYNSLAKQGISANTRIRVLHMSPRAIPSPYLSYPIVFNEDRGGVYINVNYLHSNKIFFGEYYIAEEDATPEIETEDKILIIGKDRAAVILPKDRYSSMAGIYYPVLPYNDIIGEYDIIDINGLKYVDISAVSALYGYEVIKNFSISNYSFYDPFLSHSFPGTLFNKMKINIIGYDNPHGYEKRLGVTIQKPAGEARK